MTNNWKEVYARRFFDYFDDGSKNPSTQPFHDIMEFIEETLASQRKEWVEKALGMKKGCDEIDMPEIIAKSGLGFEIAYKDGHNAALDSIASLLGKEE